MSTVITTEIIGSQLTNSKTQLNPIILTNPYLFTVITEGTQNWLPALFQFNWKLIDFCGKDKIIFA